jgi:hypothetical protein
MMKTILAGLAVALHVVVSATAQLPSAKPKSESKQAKISRALAAGPADITKNAKIIDLDERGNETVLREGNGEFTCFPGHPGVVGDVAFCANQSALQWEKDFAEYKSSPERKPSPTNTEPGIEYMLLGGTDWSGSDPAVTSGKPIKEPPHWMIMWAFDPQTTGLPTEPKQNGTWIMYAGTPWAHLMINQRP